MRLISLELEGYGRFEQRAKISLDGKLTALVGPNEAGKTTILNALERLDEANPIPPRERTRGTKPTDEAVAITALWMVEPSDLDALDLPASSDVPRWLTIYKQFDGAKELTLAPRVKRDRTLRRRLLRHLQRAKDKPWFRKLDQDDESAFEQRSLDNLVAGLSEDRETLAHEVIEQLRDAASALDEHADRAPAYASELGKELSEVAHFEETDHPEEEATKILLARTPDFLRFRSEERQLQSAYDLNDTATDEQPALRNLVRLARLDLDALRHALADEDRGLAAELIQDANSELKIRIDEAWDQTTVEPQFVNDDNVLRILVRTGRGGLHDIAQRSDGLRAFIALVAFTTERSRGMSPILLIDEAEIHLHYDAQADLVQMLSHQQQAPQVIYTTHSAGCLPQDLGTGVRIVIADEETGRSRVNNWPWKSGGGFGPILLGLGASTMAFVPTRGAVICEGAFEVVLLPTLIREAVSAETLDYQVAPGGAEASPQMAAHLDFQGHRVVWLVDGDQGGRKNRKHLQSSKIPAERILILGGENSGLATEDLVKREAFAASVNEELRRSGGDASAKMAVKDVPQRGRWKVVESWCKANRVSLPNKGAVAHRIADRRIEGPLLIKDSARVLRQLHEQLDSIFKTDETDRR